jgi:hypothetical protein
MAAGVIAAPRGRADVAARTSSHMEIPSKARIFRVRAGLFRLTSQFRIARA